MQSRVLAEELSSDDQMYLPADASVLARLRAGVKAYRALQQSPEDPAAAALMNASLDGDLFVRQAAQLLESEAGRTLFAERPMLPTERADLEALGRLEEGTVGRALARYYEENAIVPLQSPWIVRSEGDYLITWYRGAHDLHHVIMGYDTDPVGEMEVQAFTLGNVGFRHNLFILVATAIVRPAGIPPVWTYWDRLKTAYRRGKQTRSLFSVRYDHYLNEKVEKLRADLGIPN